LLPAGLCGCAITQTLDNPVFVVAMAELIQSLAELGEITEAPNP